MTQTPIWTNLTKLPDGHRLFQAVQPIPPAIKLTLPRSIALPTNGGVWAMADDSGRYPTDTDDGVLWLDFSRDLSAGAPVTNVSEGVTPGIPLVDEQGTECSTISDMATVLTLAVKFNWTINCLGTLVKVTKL